MEKKFKIISLLFIVGCILFYGFRFIYYYNKFHKKSSNNSSEILAVTIQKQGIVSDGDGLYNNSGELVYKGVNVNNYLIYSNILWRIVKVNNDNSVVITTDSVISNLSYGETSEYLDSNIAEYLINNGDNTGIFENILNDKSAYLTKNTICLDSITDASKITCKEKDTNNYISLLSIADFLNSKNEKSYLSNGKTFWLSNKYSNERVWYITSDGNLSNDKYSSIYGVRPVVTLKNTIGSIKGNGSLDNPFVIDKTKNISFNSYVKLGNDLYTVYEKNDSAIKLVNTKLINADMSRNLNYYNDGFNPKTYGTLAHYLNNTYLNTLTYKNKLINCDYYTGNYTNNYKDIYKSKVTTKVGLLSVLDINTNNTLINYLLLNKNNNIVMSINNGKTYDINKIRPTICIDKDSNFTGSGTTNDPYVLEG